MSNTPDVNIALRSRSRAILYFVPTFIVFIWVQSTKSNYTRQSSPAISVFTINWSCAAIFLAQSRHEHKVDMDTEIVMDNTDTPRSNREDRGHHRATPQNKQEDNDKCSHHSIHTNTVKSLKSALQWIVCLSQGTMYPFSKCDISVPPNAARELDRHHVNA